MTRNLSPLFTLPISRSALVIVATAGLIVSCMADTTLVKKSSANITAGISSAENADATMEMPVLFHIANNGTESAELLKWNTPLEKVLSADIFKVSRDGEPVAYIGRTMKRVSPGAGDFVVLDAGARTQTRVDLARSYDMRATGVYKITFRPNGTEDGYVNNGVEITLDSTELSLTK